MIHSISRHTLWYTAFFGDWDNIFDQKIDWIKLSEDMINYLVLMEKSSLWCSSITDKIPVKHLSVPNSEYFVNSQATFSPSICFLVLKSFMIENRLPRRNLAMF